MDSAYILCESDQTNFGTCNLSSVGSSYLGIGGTSASAPAFAGIMALVNQFTGATGQGNANYVLYKMASSSAQTSQSCGATSNPSTGCIFYDVTSGTISMPCAKGSPNCNFSNASDTYGVMAGYSATPAYDQATGLGSVNAYNLVHNWSKPTAISTTTLSLNSGAGVNITHGQNVSFSIAVTPSAATGVVSLLGSPSGSGFIPMASFPLVNGSASGTTAALAGGTSYSVKAHYPGTGTYIPSDSMPVTVTVAPEPSKTLISIPVFDPTTGRETANTPTSFVYGTPSIARVDVGNANAAVTYPMHFVCTILSCPTGNVTLTDSVSGGPSGPFTLTSEGYAEDLTVQFSGGTHQLSASYSGDSSYTSSTGSYTLTVTPAPTQATGPNFQSNTIAGNPTYMSININTTVLFGAVPTGTITFYDGTTAISGAVTLNGQQGASGSYASLFGYIIATFTTSGSHSITAKYSGDANYAAVTSSPASISVLYPTTANETLNLSTINLGQSVTVTATSTSSFSSPPMTGTFQFSGYNGFIGGPVIPTLSMDGSGNQVLTATLTTTPPAAESVYANYSGDSNFASSSKFPDFYQCQYSGFQFQCSRKSVTRFPRASQAAFP